MLYSEGTASDWALVCPREEHGRGERADRGELRGKMWGGRGALGAIVNILDYILSEMEAIRRFWAEEQRN